MIEAVIALIQQILFKATGSSYDQDVHSVEAIGDEVAGLNAILPASGTLQGAAFVKGVEVELIFPIYDKTGALVSSAAGLDSEVSKDGGAFSDCTNEASEIGSSGIYKLTLTATEMNADRVCIITKTSTTDAKTTVTVIYTSPA